MTNPTEICLHPPFTQVLPGRKSISGPTSHWTLAGGGRLSNKPLKYGAILLHDYSHYSLFFKIPLKYNTKFSLNQPSFKAADYTSAKQILKIKFCVPKTDSVQIWKWDKYSSFERDWMFFFLTEKLNNA